MDGRHVYVAPRDPKAEPVCLLTREWAERRKVPVDALLSECRLEQARPDGIEYHLQSGAAMWTQVETFIEEESECCPFLAFEATEADDEIILRIIQPETAR